ncbi:hypothetical protein CSIV_04840 [Microbacterium sp. CSI-V]|nr:hypothetical protein CSIV_04840 [Microbacterium sp. CSI-V]
MPVPSALILRHVEDLYGDLEVPAEVIARLSRHDRWPDVLPKLGDLPPEGRDIVTGFRALTPALRGQLLALALQRDAGVLALDPATATASGFVDVERGGLITWNSDVHRLSVLAGAEREDHLLAAEACSTSPSGRHGGALHLLLAGEPVESTELGAAAEFFVASDRPSWAMACLVRAGEAAPTPDYAAMYASTAANVAAFEGDFTEAERVLQYFTLSDTRVLIRESAPTRALRQAIVDNNTGAARATIAARLEQRDLTPTAVGEALSVYALANMIDGDPTAWGDFLGACSAATVDLHPSIAAITATIGAPNAVLEAHLDPAPGDDKRGWVQLAGCVASVVLAYRDMRLASISSSAELARRSGNRLIRTVAATWLSVMLAHNQHWEMLESVTALAIETTRIVPAPLMRLNAEALIALRDAFRGETESARVRLDRVRADPVLRRAYRLRLVLDSVEVLIEGPQGNYEHALALLSTREPDILDLTVGPCGPVELFDFVDYAILLGQIEDAAARVELTREILPPYGSERAAFVLSACDAAIAVRTSLAPAEALLARSQAVPFVYEAARLRLVYAERLRRLGRTAEARRHLHRVEIDLKSVDAGAWLERVRRELRACQRDVVVRVAELTEQEARIAELAAGGLSNKEIGHQLYLSPRTVGGHLYKVFPKLGITTRAQLRDALAAHAAGNDAQP